ncbi:MAG TPA: monovalent cation/H(+) antiporter subunit G, partial [Chitinophagales bacterium]|nr:monovalent cation/H(+) antiporter subunit G [Chitinophagales bacterium]
IEIAIATISTIGAIFILIAAYGMLRMPDFYLRMTVTVKASTMGVGLILLATGLYFQDFSITTKILAIIFFFLITAPVAAHMIARTSYIIGVELWEKTVLDELEGKYHETTHALKGDESDDE